MVDMCRSGQARCWPTYDSLFSWPGWIYFDRIRLMNGRVERIAMASEAEILEENRRVRRLQIVVDLVTNVLWQSDDMPVEEAAELVAAVRLFALKLFPDKEQTYDLIYASRFRRLMREKYGMM